MDSEEFRQWRTDYVRLTQSEAAEKLGITPRMVRHYEAGTRRIPPRTAQRCKDVGLRRRLYARRSEYDPRRDQAQTPLPFFKRVNREFHFDLDAAALPATAKCRHYFTPDDDAFSREWHGSVWLNPPYWHVNLAKWIAKAFEEAQTNAKVVVVLVPNRTDTDWWRDYALRAAEIKFIRGRLNNFNRSVLLFFRKAQTNSRPALSVIDAWMPGEKRTTAVTRSRKT